MNASVNIYRLAALWFLLCAFGINDKTLMAQGEDAAESNRVGITFCLITYDNQYAPRIESAFRDADFPAKYFDNQVEPFMLTLSRSYEKAEQTLNDGDKQLRISKAKEFFEANDISRKIVGKWYNYTPGEGFDLSLLFNRAEYNATDEEIKVSHASKRGEARIRDYGHQLVGNSYVAVVDLRGLKKEVMQEANSAGVTYSADMGLYLFKLKFDDEEIDKFFDVWVYQDDDSQTVKEKTERFESMVFPLELKFSKKEWISLTGVSNSSLVQALTKQKMDIGKLDKEAFGNFIDNIVSNTDHHASKSIEDFAVRRKVMNIRPIRSKIGKKESLQTDDRFEVYEYIWNEQKEEAVPKRKAVIRASEVADNRSEASRSLKSSFYQIYGGTVEEGMVLKEKPDLGMSLMGYYVDDALGGGGLRLMYRIGKHIQVPSLYLSADVAFDGENYEDFTGNPQYPYIYDMTDDDISFVRWSAGLGKGYRLFRYLEFIPQFSVGMESASIDDENYSTLFYRGGAMLGISILPTVQLYGMFCYESPVGEAIRTPENGDAGDAESTDSEWNRIFPGRTGGEGIEAGIRIEF